MEGSQLLEFAKYAWGLFVILGAWIMNRLFNRVTELERESITQTTFNETLKALRSDIKEVGRVVREDARAIHSRIDKFMDK